MELITPETHGTALSNSDCTAVHVRRAIINELIAKNRYFMPTIDKNYALSAAKQQYKLEVAVMVRENTRQIKEGLI